MKASKSADTTSTSATSKSDSDRFIPNRGGTIDGGDYTYSSGEDAENVSENMSSKEMSSDFNKLLIDTTTGEFHQSDVEAGTRVLAYKNKAPAPQEGYQNSLKVLYAQKTSKKADMGRPTRHISSAPVRKLDAPEMLDDYYLNLVDWSQKNDLVVGLQNCVYIWSATSSKVTKLHDLGADDEVTSVSWAKRGTHLSVGTDSGMVQVWDVNH